MSQHVMVNTGALWCCTTGAQRLHAGD